MFFIIVFSLKPAAQPWVRAPYLKVSKEEAGFFELREAFYAYWGDAPYLKGKGFKQFKRWEYINFPRSYPDGFLVSVDAYFKVRQEIERKHLSNPERTDNSSWTPLGITSWINGPNGYNPGNGRVNVVCVNPQNSQQIYIGAPSGGLWKTIDGGSAWNTNFDNMPHLGVSSIAIHPDSSHIVYVGTGDRDAYDTKCIGIYKSVDGGNTWTPSGFNTANEWNSINKILFNPLNPSTMFAATNYGVYKSINSGQNWVNVFDDSWVTDLVFNPEDTAILYGSGGYFIRSTNGGQSFIKNTTLPNDTCRLELAVTPANSDYVYVLASNASYQFGGLFRSQDEGLNFTLMSDTPNIFGYETDGSDDAGQAWYDMAIAASPVNADEIFIGGINVWKSTNGGQNWINSSYWIYDTAANYTHADIHYLGFFGNRLFCGSDGGVFYSDDNGQTWIDISQGLGISQFYRMASSPINPGFIIGGTQDNGSNRLENGVWEHIFGADGMQPMADHADINTFYFSYQCGGLMKTSDNGLTVDYIMPNDSIEGDWVTPFAMHPLDNQIIYAGYDDVYKSYNGGWTWQKISDSLTGGNNLTHLKVAQGNAEYIYAACNNKLYVSKDDGISWSSKTIPFSGTITGITVAPINPEKIWITASGSNGDRVFKSTDAGQTLQNMTLNINGTGIRCITNQPNSPDGVYVGTENAVFYTDTTLTQWIPFFNGLPNVIVSDLEINENAGKIRAATYGRGIWESPLMSPTGISETKELKPFNIFPNPCEGLLNIDFSSSDSASLILFDINGRHVQSFENITSAKATLNLKDLVSGVYFLRIDLNNHKYIERIVLYN